MKLILDDRSDSYRFAPLTLTRPVSELRTGILTNSERFQRLIPGADISYRTLPYLQEKFPLEESKDALSVSATLIPNKAFITALLELRDDQVLLKGETWLAQKGTGSEKVFFEEELIILQNRWDLFQKNGEILAQDFELLTRNRASEKLSASNTLIGDPTRLFIEEGAKVEAAVINVNEGPVYIGKNAEVMEGSLIRGALALGEHATLKLGTKVYGATSIGPHCKVGGEVSNVIFQGYSNKGHDGFLGNSLIGEWCNLGADTNCSNLKNNYGNIRTYSYEAGREVQTDLTFMGLSMGDHSKCGINTMFNTASVVGVCANIFGADFPPKFIPSFTWGTADRYDPERAFESISNMMARRGKTLGEADRNILHFLFEQGK